MSLTWKVLVIILAVLGGTAFLAYAGIFSAQYASGIFSAVVAAVITGHYVSSSSNKGGPLE